MRRAQTTKASSTKCYLRGNTRQCQYVACLGLPPHLEEAKTGVTNTLPSWPGFQGYYQEAAAFLTEKMGTLAPTEVYSAVLLADLAYGCAEGLPEAVALLKSPDNTCGWLLARVSRETMNWLPLNSAGPAMTTLLAFQHML
jgi:hypothetical protein